MEFVRYFLQKKQLTVLLLVLTIAGGIFSYVKMGKLEDAPFTIKQAVVMTPYPGASPSEVQSQVTDVLEESIQSLGELYYLKTENRAGMSKITVYVKKEIRADEMQQLWDKLRRKVGDVQGRLPDGAGPSVVNDDFGDVLGVFYGLRGDNRTYRELEDEAKLIKDELLKVKDVARVEISGVPDRTIDVTVSPAVMSASGITAADISRAFTAQNRIVDAGGIDSGDRRIRIESTGNFYSLDDIRNLTIVSSSGEHFRLGEIADIRESYRNPPENLMRIDGSPAVGIAISTVPTGNVVDMAEAVRLRLEEFSRTMPEGFVLSSIYDQGHESAVANRGFIINLVVSVLTVVAILLFFIGFKNGILIGSGLIFSIFATLIVMMASGIALQRMSLAAIIIAMGMLVDNAIVVTDSALVNMELGMRKRIAIMRACSSTALPLLAATVIAFLTFMPIYFSPHITGELLSSMVIVIGVSLMFSWIFAMFQTPFFIQEFVRRPRPEELKPGLYDGKYYNIFRKALGWVLGHRWFAVAIPVVLLALSAWGFRYIPKVFVPSLDKQYFTVDMWLPEGTNIYETDRMADNISRYIRDCNSTETVSAYIGRTPPRYYLSNLALGPQSNYAQLLVKCRSSKEARALQDGLQDTLRRMFPEPMIRVNRFELNTVNEAMIEARFLGPDPAVLDSLVNVAAGIMRQNPKTADVRNEWGNMVMAIRPVYDPVKAGMLGITKAEMMQSVKSISDGLAIGTYRDGEHKVPVLLKSAETDITDARSLAMFPVWNGTKSAPLSQVTGGVETVWEWPQIRTYNRQLSMAAMCGVQDGCTMAEVHGEIRKEIEAIRLPEGYKFFWDSQYKDQKEGIQALTKFFPLAFILLVVILVALFGNFREPGIILCILPLSLIGVVAGMLATGFDFGFFPIAGWLGLLGMIIKNVIVLLDEINIQRRKGTAPHTAVIEATVSRTRPVLMAAILLPAAAAAQQNGMLEKYREMAVEYSHDLKAAEKNVSASIELEKAARKDLYPKLSGSADFQYSVNPMQVTLDIPETGTTLSYEGSGIRYGTAVTLSQPVYAGGRLLENIRLAQSQQMIGKYQEEYIRAGICYQTDIQYWNTVARGEIVKVSEEYRNSIASLVETIGNRVRNGFANPQDLLMMEVRLNEAEFQVLQARKNLDNSMMAFNSLIGADLHEMTGTEDSVAVVSIIPSDLADSSVSNRPELRIAMEEINVAESQMNIAMSRYNPQFSIGMDGTFSSPGYDFRPDPDPNYAVYAKLSVPIFEWGKRRNEKRMYSYKVDAASDNLSKVSDRITLEVETARNSLEQAIRQIELAERSLTKARENERMALMRYDEGESSIIEVIDAQTYRQSAQLSYIRAKTSAQESYSGLMRALNRY